MAEDLHIRLVPVEFLRGGPPHNQLLSPLTQYLAICGEAGAGIVTVPYEHAEFERRLKELRYETGDAVDRQAMLHSTGDEMGKILGAVPGLAGALINDPSRQGTLIQLRLTLSASELALLPFEVAKLPVSASATAESWLSVQTRPPVCVTRNIRTVSPEGVLWPTRPRILFVSGDPENVPFADHRRVLLDAIQPFQYPDRDDLSRSPDGTREQAGELLTILVNPTLADVLRECREHQYTHVHILTHGDLSETSDRFGLMLNGPEGAPDVVSGEQFASALTSLSAGQLHRPTVVTIASCDSGNVGTVVIPGASFAHALHQAGIPLVVASQFPLSKEGSIPLASMLYEGLLWGEHPLVLLQQLRAELHALYTSSWHDWASLVVYEALPQALPDQLEALRYAQTRRAINAALERVDRAVHEAREKPGREHLPEIDAAIERAVGQLPLHGQYGVECLGLRASARKRLAEAAFTLAASVPEVGAPAWRDPYDLLDQAWNDYQSAVRGLLVSDAHGVQRIASLHWVLVQVVSLSLVLGKEIDERQWAAATLSADLYREHPSVEERAWAHGSLAELSLLRLGQPGLLPEQRTQYSSQAVQHAREVARLYPWGDEFPVKSTRRQFRRYVEWWGTSRFEEELRARDVGRRASWDGADGLLETARRMVAVLQRQSAGPAPSQGTPPPRSAPTSGKPVATATANGTPPAPKPTPSQTVSAKPPTRPPGSSSLFFDITMLPAGHGDSLWIEYGDRSSRHRLLIDCGTQQTSRELLRRVEALPERERRLELFVMSHIDSDHIGGALPFFKAVRQGLQFGDVWFNGWRHVSGRLGAKQGEMFSTALMDLELPWNAWRDGAAIVLDSADLPVCELPGGMRLTLLSPGVGQLKKLAPVWSREMKKYGLVPGSRVDYSRFLKGTPSTSTDVDALADAAFAPDAGVPNGTSIALLAEFGGATALFAADAHAPVLTDSLKTLLRTRGAGRLTLDAFKVSHHASQNNLSTELLQLVDCQRYLVSTNGNHFCHPDRQAIARVIKYGGNRPALVFNYRSRYNDVWERPNLQEQYRYTAHYPEAESIGSTVSLLLEGVRA
jgi:beta-lactamase superfamily II metal-dependent hydrolase